MAILYGLRSTVYGLRSAVCGSAVFSEFISPYTRKGQRRLPLPLLTED
jgi:hypothetical protein